jgi:cytochrome o ubiquinol oxidase subunit 1
MKQRAIDERRLIEEPAYEPIEVPRNSPVGVVSAFFASITGFALIWHIWWLVIVGLIGAFATLMALAWRREDEFVIPAAAVAKLDRTRRHTREQILPTLTRAA